jgi:hypothetical protein
MNAAAGGRKEHKAGDVAPTVKAGTANSAMGRTGGTNQREFGGLRSVAAGAVGQHPSDGQRARRGASRPRRCRELAVPDKQCDGADRQRQ